MQEEIKIEGRGGPGRGQGRKPIGDKPLGPPHTIKLPQEAEQKVKEIALKRGISMEAVIRQGFLDWLETYDEPIIL